MHELPDDLPSNPAGRPGACVVDLRFAKSDESAASALKAWVKFNASARTPVFVLENSETVPSILAAVPEGTGGLVVLAPVSDKLAPDVAVQVSPTWTGAPTTRLKRGRRSETLLSDYPDKPRIDEAYLEKEHLADSDAPDERVGQAVASRPAGRPHAPAGGPAAPGPARPEEDLSRPGFRS